MLISFDGTFIVAAISFIIFMIIMKLILYKPLSTVIEERERFYEKNTKTALESKQKAKQTLEQKEEEISKTRASASNLVKEVSDFAKKTKSETIFNAKKQASETLNKTKQELDAQSLNAKEELKNEVENYVKHIVNKVLEKDVEIHLDEEKISKVLSGADFGGSKNV